MQQQPKPKTVTVKQRRSEHMIRDLFKVVENSKRPAVNARRKAVFAGEVAQRILDALSQGLS